jgi:hypothetical protein
MNEPYFQGSFPSNPVMPTTLLLEGLAQTAGALCMHHLKVNEPPLIYFMSIDKARLRRASDSAMLFIIAWRKFAVAGAYGETGAGQSLMELLSLRPNLARRLSRPQLWASPHCGHPTSSYATIL